MHERTPAIQNLLRIGKMATNEMLAKESGIVLWCRLYDEKKRNFQPYTCMGRVAYHCHDSSVHPIKFVWGLLDYETLMNVRTDEEMEEMR